MIVSKTSGGLKWAAWAKRDGDWERLVEEIDALPSLDALEAYRPVLTKALRSLPEVWDEHFWDRLNERRAELLNADLDSRWKARL